MKLHPSLLVLAIAGIIAPVAVAGQQSGEVDWGQKARPVTAAQAGETGTVMNRVFGLCKGVPASLAYQGIPYSLGPLGNAQQYFELYERREIDIPPATQVSVVTAPKHGSFVVSPASSASEFAGYDYVPEVGYLGKDSLSLRVELGEMSVTLKYFFNIQKISDDAADSLCNETGKRWKISYVPEGVINSAITDTQLSAWLSST